MIMRILPFNKQFTIFSVSSGRNIFFDFTRPGILVYNQGVDNPTQQSNKLVDSVRSWMAGINWISVVILLAVLIAVSAPVYSYRILNPVNSDFGNHNLYAVRILRGEDVPAHILAHPIYAYILGGLIWVTRSGLDADHAAVLLMTACQALTGLLIYLWLGRRAGRWSEALRVLLAAGVTLAAPLMMLLPLDGRYYFGYIGLANYHNPTIGVLRSLAVLTLIISLALFNSSSRKTWLLVVLAAVVTALGTLAKPNLALIWLPALALEWLWRGGDARRRLVLPFVFGFFIPAGAILIWQYLATYTSINGGSGGIIWAPLAVEGGSSAYLAGKFLLSIWYVLVGGVLYGRKLVEDRGLRLTWIAFLFGAAMVYLLAESGNRLDDGNFRWGAQVGLLLLFTAQVKFLWQKPVWTRIEKTLLIAGLGPHVIAGVAYLVHCLVSKTYG